jgi:hypothetical protein
MVYVLHELYTIVEAGFRIIFLGTELNLAIPNLIENEESHLAEVEV